MRRVQVGKVVSELILIVDDDMYIGNMVEEVLKKDGYEIKRAYSGTEALMVLEKDKPSLVLLDLMLPGMDGEEVLSHIKGIPVIIMSAKAGVDDKVNLLMSGASDYITKPFDINELKARIAVQLRLHATMATASDDGNVVRAGRITLDSDILTVSVDGKEAVLTRTEAAILKILMSNNGRPVGRNTILDKISYDTPDCTERSLKQHISNIRKKLEALTGVDYIEAIYGIGFKFNA